jgi:hypothetical protein
MYRFYKVVQRGTNLNFSKLMVSLVLLLSILSNTLFSTAFIMVLFYLMFVNRFFLNIEQARKQLRPLIKNFLIPFILIEILLHFIYQIPAEYWEITVQENKIIYRKYNFDKVFQLMCKGFIFFLLNLQAQIIESSSFNRLRDIIRIGALQG